MFNVKTFVIEDYVLFSLERVKNPFSLKLENTSEKSDVLYI